MYNICIYILLYIAFTIEIESFKSGSIQHSASVISFAVDIYLRGFNNSQTLIIFSTENISKLSSPDLASFPGSGPPEPAFDYEDEPEESMINQLHRACCCSHSRAILCELITHTGLAMPLAPF